MMTQETTLVKTWREFNLAILKVKSKTIMKELKFYNSDLDH